MAAALDCKAFAGQYVQQQARKWASQVDQLANVAKTQPECAYAANRYSFVSHWTFLARTVEGIGDLREQESPAELEKELFALPADLRDLCKTDPTTSVSNQFQASKQVTAPLVALIVQQKI